MTVQKYDSVCFICYQLIHMAKNLLLCTFYANRSFYSCPNLAWLITAKNMYIGA